MNSGLKKTLVCLTLFAVLGASAQGAKLSLKFTGGGAYLLGGDYNKAMDGWRNYEKTVVGASETFVDNLKKIGLGFQIGAELMAEFNPNLALGLEVGYLGASVESGFSRSWHNYKLTLTPSISAVPILLNVHYFIPLGEKLKLHAVAGAGAFLSHLEYGYAIEDINSPYSGTWKPASKTVFGGKAGIGFEYSLSASMALTFDVIGRFAEITGFKGGWSGNYQGVEKSGTATLYYYDLDGTYPLIGLYETTPSGVHIQNAREAKFSLSGVAALIGIKIGL